MLSQEIIKSQSGLPLLEGSQIEQLAEECAHTFFPEMFEKPQPIDPERFIEFSLGCSIDYLYLSSCQLYLGMTCFKDTVIPVFNRETFRAELARVEAGTVVIDRGLYEQTLMDGHRGRLRFTQAHEAAHCILHGDYFLNAARSLENGEAEVCCSSCSTALTEADLAEHQADTFAASFLIPETALRKLLDSCRAWDWEDRHKLRLVKETFDVSWPAAFYRLRKLGWLECRTTVFNWDEISEN